MLKRARLLEGIGGWGSGGCNLTSSLQGRGEGSEMGEGEGGPEVNSEHERYARGGVETAWRKLSARARVPSLLGWSPSGEYSSGWFQNTLKLSM